MNMQTSDSIVIIPTYNERENIENIIRAVFALEHGFHILVVEDGSPDGTAAIVKDLQREFPHRLFMVERKGKLGLGSVPTARTARSKKSAFRCQKVVRSMVK